jgi:hypothetical protein
MRGFIDIEIEVGEGRRPLKVIECVVHAGDPLGSASPPKRKSIPTATSPQVFDRQAGIAALLKWRRPDDRA